MADTGLRDAGYEYVNLDCGYTTGFRASNGSLLIDYSKFPHGIKWLADQIHNLGLKFGIYASASEHQCCSRIHPDANDGSYGFEEKDAQFFAESGVDYLKFDSCNPVNESYYAMRDALNKTGRKILYSIHGPKAVPELANAWRTTGDVSNQYSSFMERAILNNETSDSAGPGGWNMPDMLEVGNFYNEFSNAESRTMMSIWAVAKAPLLIGTDVTLKRSEKDETLEILKNKDVIAINQDELGIQGILAAQPNNGTAQVWTGPLSGNDQVLLIVNTLNTTQQDVDVDIESLFDTGKSWKARDLWQGKDMPKPLSGKVTFKVEQHDVLLMRLTPMTS